MHGINLTADMDARTLIPADPSAKIGASADEGSDSIAVTFSPALPEGAVADIVYGIIVRMNGTIGHPFSRLDTDGDCVVPSQVLAGCTAGTLPVSVRVTYADGSVGCTPEVVLGVDMVPDPVTEAESKGFPLLMTRDSSWAWEKSWVYQKGSMVTYGDSVYVSTANDNVGNVPDGLVGWKLATESATVWGGITGTLANQRDLADALAGKADVSALNALGQTVAGKQDALTFDSAPTAESVNPVTSGGVYSALDGKVSKSGDTMTGPLTVRNQVKVNDLIMMFALKSREDLTNETVLNSLISRDANNKTNGTIRFSGSKDGPTIAGFWSIAYKPDDTQVWSGLYLSSYPDGGRYAAVTLTPDYNDNSTKIATTAYVMANPHLIRDFGNQSIAGIKTFTSSEIRSITGQATRVKPDTAPTQRQFFGRLSFYGSDAGVTTGHIYTSRETDNSVGTHIGSMQTIGGRDYGSELILFTKADGTGYATCPNPPANATGTEIATAGWVRTLVASEIQKALQ